jgi:PKD repeat protein
VAWAVTKNGTPFAAGSGAAFAFTPNDNGTYVVTLTATDKDGGVGTASQTIAVTNVDPTAAVTGAPTSSPEGTAIVVSSAVSDPSSIDTAQGFARSWSVTKNGSPFASGSGISFAFTPNDNGTYVVTLTATDKDGGQAFDSKTVTVTNVAPTVALTGPASGSITPIGAPVTFTGTYADPGSADTHTAVLTITSVGTGAVTTTPVTFSGGTVSFPYTFTAAGVYHVTLTVTDDDGGAGSAATVGGFDAMVVAYDASAGFVTGGGWINSPAGAYAANPALAGKAIFGFVAKYQKGANTPTGQTEFQFQLAGLDFHSTSYDWLVVAGARAQYKGSGTINGAGDYGFMLTAIDGVGPGGGGADRFRIKIWNKATGAVVYDNQLGAADDSNPTTALGGGSIIVHK